MQFLPWTLCFTSNIVEAEFLQTVQAEEKTDEVLPEQVNLQVPAQ